MTPSSLRLLTNLPDLPDQVADAIALGRDIAAALDTAQGRPVDWAHVAEQLAATPTGKRAAYARAAIDNHATYLARRPLAAELRRAAALDVEAALHRAVTTHLERILQLIAGRCQPLRDGSVRDSLSCRGESPRVAC